MDASLDASLDSDASESYEEDNLMLRDLKSRGGGIQSVLPLAADLIVDPDLSSASMHGDDDAFEKNLELATALSLTPILVIFCPVHTVSLNFFCVGLISRNRKRF